jgi:hypothetical protein
VFERAARTAHSMMVAITGSSSRGPAGPVVSAIDQPVPLRIELVGHLREITHGLEVEDRDAMDTV